MDRKPGPLSCTGHPMVNTPNLDCLPARWTAFANACTPSPIRVPAPAALATAKYVHQTGFRDNALAHDGPPPPPNWGHALANSGLNPVNIGKLHDRNREDSTGFSKQVLLLHIADGIGRVWGSGRAYLRTGR